MTETVTRRSGKSLVLDVTQFKQHRLKCGLTQGDLARRMKVSVTSVSRWESGIDQPGARRFPKLAKLLKIDPLELTRVIEPEQVKAAVA